MPYHDFCYIYRISITFRLLRLGRTVILPSLLAVSITSQLQIALSHAFAHSARNLVLLQQRTLVCISRSVAPSMAHLNIPWSLLALTAIRFSLYPCLHTSIASFYFPCERALLPPCSHSKVSVAKYQRCSSPRLFSTLIIRPYPCMFSNVYIMAPHLSHTYLPCLSTILRSCTNSRRLALYDHPSSSCSPHSYLAITTLHYYLRPKIASSIQSLAFSP